MGDKCAAAINVLALAVTLLRAISNLKAAPGVRRMSTLWALHHFFILRRHLNLNNDTQTINIKNLFIPFLNHQSSLQAPDWL